VRAYHYTSTTHLEYILREGELKRTESNLSAVSPRLGPDVVWLIDSPDLEGANHGLAGSMVDKTEVCFEVEAPDRWTTRWVDWAKLQGIDQLWLESLVRFSGGEDQARRWYVSFAKIPREAWVRVWNTKTDQVYYEREARE
jgi:hypothetical protein